MLRMSDRRTVSSLAITCPAEAWEAIRDARLTARP